MAVTRQRSLGVGCWVPMLLCGIVLSGVLLLLVSTRYEQYIKFGLTITSSPKYQDQVGRGRNQTEIVLIFMSNGQKTNDADLRERVREIQLLGDKLEPYVDHANAYTIDVESSVVPYTEILPFHSTKIAFALHLGSAMKLEEERNVVICKRNKCIPFSTLLQDVINVHFPYMVDESGQCSRNQITKYTYSATYIFLVETNLFVDYGEAFTPGVRGWDPKRKRDWLNGRRSPYPVHYTAITRPKKFRDPSNSEIDHKLKLEWRNSWWSRQGIVAQIIHPQAKYQRSFIIETLHPVSSSLSSKAPQVPPFSGFGIESFASSLHVSSFELFFNGLDPLDAVIQALTMCYSVSFFSDFWSILQSSVGEYILVDDEKSS